MDWRRWTVGRRRPRYWAPVLTALTLFMFYDSGITFWSLALGFFVIVEWVLFFRPPETWPSS